MSKNYSYNPSNRSIVFGDTGNMYLNEALRLKLADQTAYMEKKTLKEIPHFSLLKNNVKGAKLFISELMKGKFTRIIGDYDADGMCGTAILISGCRQLGFGESILDYVIPSRLKDGYGLSPNIVKKAIDDGVEVIVTVDNGIAAVDAIKMAKDAGIVVIITDHHTAPAILPVADVLINPRVPGETLPFTLISGATVAWYFLAAIREELGTPLDLLQFMDLIALTIMSDVMPLDNINLAFLKKGMEQIKSREKKLYQLSWPEEWHQSEEIDETALSFIFVPMLNALGRIDDANKGVQLLMSRDQKEIQKIFFEMKEVNETRKMISRKSTEEAESYVLDEVDSNANVVIVKGDYHEGIVGIIAGRIAEIHTKPAIVMSYNEETGLYKGSARTVGNIHLYDFIFQASEFIEYGGGHKGAVGLAVRPEKFEQFKKKLEEISMEIPKEDFINNNLIPISIKLHHLTDDVFSTIREFGPYGNTNPKPKFITKGIVSDARPIRDGLHYEAKVTDPETNYTITALFFNIRNKDSFLEAIKEEIEFSCEPLLKYDKNTKKYVKQISCKLL